MGRGYRFYGRPCYSPRIVICPETWEFYNTLLRVCMAVLPQEHDEVQIPQPTVWRMIGQFQAACQLVVLLVTDSDFRPMESEK